MVLRSLYFCYGKSELYLRCTKEESNFAALRILDIPVRGKAYAYAEEHGERVQRIRVAKVANFVAWSTPTCDACASTLERALPRTGMSKILCADTSGEHPMRLIHYSHPDPAMNLALEEVLLDEVEQGRQPDILRFWESPVPFVVLGTAQVLAEEVNESNCVADGVPIMRRCTAGGCVLQGPGSFNYALFLTYESYPEVASLHASYRFILGKVCAALATLDIEASHQGISDIAIGGLKVSGNAQRRRRRALLHHGTLLYRADAAAISRYIREPADRPDYRGTRTHGEFVTALPANPEALRSSMAVAFEALEGGVPTGEELERASALAQEKYRLDSWIRRR